MAASEQSPPQWPHDAAVPPQLPTVVVIEEIRSGCGVGPTGSMFASLHQCHQTSQAFIAVIVLAQRRLRGVTERAAEAAATECLIVARVENDLVPERVRDLAGHRR